MAVRDWFLIAGAAAALAPAIAVGQPASAAEGKAIAASGTAGGVAACASCHGAQGQGSAGFPRLAATGRDYLQAQLDAFASGARTSPVMQPFAQKLTATQRQSLALYFSELPAPYPAQAASDPQPQKPGEWLASRGRWPSGIPACAQCHGPGGHGVGTQIPPLAGLPAAYIDAQLHAWKDGTRPAGPLGLMGMVAKKLSDKDIAEVAAYYAANDAANDAAQPAPAPTTGGKP